MQALIDAIKAQFAGDSWLSDTANVKGVRYAGADDDPGYPYCVFTVSEDAEHYAGGHVNDARVQFNVYDDQRDETRVVGVMEHLISAFDGQTLAIEGAAGLAPQLATATAYPNEQRRWQATVIFDLKYR